MDLDNQDNQRDVDNRQNSEMDTADTPSSADIVAELERTRAALAKANEEAKTRRLQLQQFEEQQKKQKLSEMDEVERLKAELADAQQAQTAVSELNERLDAVNQTVEAQVKTLFKSLSVPKHVQKLLLSLSPVQQLEYLAEHQDQFTPKQAPPTDAGQRGGGRRASSDDIKQAKRGRFNYSRI